MSHDAVAALIGAWALDACSPEETALVEGHLSGCPACAREARALQDAAADLGGAFLKPAAGLLDAARARRRPAAAAPAYAAPYAAQVAALDLLLSDLAPHDWAQTAAYEEMTVRDLVVHLAAVDGLVADALGLAVEPPVRAGERLAERTEAALRVEKDRTPEQIRRSWRTQADAVCGAPPRPVTVALGGPLNLADALIARAFETWIHGEDIAAATGRPSIPPLAEHLHPMADLAARLLPRVVSRRIAAPTRDRHLRLHLTGAGGGTWTVPLDPAATAAATSKPAATVVVDVVAFCRLAADRLDPGRIAVEISGDTALARDFLAALPALAPVP